MILYKQIQGGQLQNRLEQNIPTIWMSRWVTFRINGLFHLLINGDKMGLQLTNPPILAFDPNLQRDIQNIENRKPQTHKYHWRMAFVEDIVILI